VVEAMAHLKGASGLPPRNPMSWVVDRQIYPSARQLVRGLGEMA
jgi:hypothetical protein